MKNATLPLLPLLRFSLRLFRLIVAIADVIRCLCFAFAAAYTFAAFMMLIFSFLLMLFAAARSYMLFFSAAFHISCHADIIRFHYVSFHLFRRHIFFFFFIIRSSLSFSFLFMPIVTFFFVIFIDII